jgi:hypothetical protein
MAAQPVARRTGSSGPACGAGRFAHWPVDAATHGSDCAACTLPGVDIITAHIILAEIGTQAASRKRVICPVGRGSVPATRKVQASASVGARARGSLSAAGIGSECLGSCPHEGLRARRLQKIGYQVTLASTLASGARPTPLTKRHRCPVKAAPNAIFGESPLSTSDRGQTEDF